MLRNIAIFTGALDFNCRWNVVTLAERFPETQFTILHHTPHKTVRMLISSQVCNFRRHGWRWATYQLAEIISFLITCCRKPPTKSADVPGRAYTLDALRNHDRIRIETFTDINGKDGCELLKRLSPDLGIAIGAPILKAHLFEIPKYGSINLHKGHLPHYRGMPPAFWELKNGEQSVGCTIHKITSGLDRGDILLEESLLIDRYSTVAGMQARLHHLGVNLLCDAVELIRSGKAIFRKQPPGGKTNMRPPLATERMLYQQLKANMPVERLARRLGKTIVFFLYSSIFKNFINYVKGRLGKPSVIILLYHRVSDRFKDNVTVGIEQFDQQMAHISANFKIISLREFINGDVPRTSSKPIIAVSFDDGYLDNFENAAPILLKHQVPCTFFISTEKITKNEPFNHDLKLLGFGLDNMSWEQVHQMHRWGFDFGSHTCNHVNLADVSDSVAMDELRSSYNELRTRLNQNISFIAYPFGGRHHITSARIEMIKEVGYSACFSAYGGSNRTGDDPFGIKRIGINWGFDMTAFKARLQGWDNARRITTN